jgi:hypothetical protein
MRSGLAMLLALSVSPLMSAQSVAAHEQETSKQKNASKKVDSSSLTGCIDQHDGQYVLIHDQTRSTIANLEAVGFPTEGFAKHLGEKVTVRGTASPSGTDHPVFKVRAVEKISDTCGPEQH